MTLPAAATKVHLDASTDDPSQARAELVALIDKFNALLAALPPEFITIQKNGLKMFAGTISPTGAITWGSGTGFTCVRNSTGQYTVTLAAAMNINSPVVANTMNNMPGAVVFPTRPTDTTIVFNVRVPGSGSSDEAFYFITVGD